MARQLPGDTYTICEKRWKSLIWRECKICRINFKWEPYYIISTDRDLRFPSDLDKEKKIVRYFPNTEHQAVCTECAKKFGLDQAAIKPIKHEEFEAMVNKMHESDPPLPIHDGTLNKISIKAIG